MYDDSFPSSLPQKATSYIIAIVFLLYFCVLWWIVIVKLYIYISYLPVSCPEDKLGEQWLP